jgi:hypothetical protein
MLFVLFIYKLILLKCGKRQTGCALVIQVDTLHLLFSSHECARVLQQSKRILVYVCYVYQSSYLPRSLTTVLLCNQAGLIGLDLD